MGIGDIILYQPLLFDSHDNNPGPKKPAKPKKPQSEKKRKLAEALASDPKQAEKKEKLGDLLGELSVLRGDFHYFKEDIRAIEQIADLDRNEFPATQIADGIYGFICQLIGFTAEEMNSKIGQCNSQTIYKTKKEILQTGRSNNTVEKFYCKNEHSKLVFNSYSKESLKAHSKKWIYKAEETLTELFRDLRKDKTNPAVIWRFLVLLKKGLDLHKDPSANNQKPKPR